MVTMLAARGFALAQAKAFTDAAGIRILSSSGCDGAPDRELTWVSAMSDAVAEVPPFAGRLLLNCRQPPLMG
jgi:hypothetical protein